MNVRNLIFASSFSLFLTFSAQGQVYQKIENQYGPVLGYSTASGVKILSIAGNKFKDLNRNGKLDRYEDWRLTAEERAKDLASKLSVDQIAGLCCIAGIKLYRHRPLDLWEALIKEKTIRKV